MARKVMRVTIDDSGRDNGKTFVLTEMSADQGERWALRALFALMNVGVEVPDNIAFAGMAGIAALGIAALGRLPYEAAEPLLREMFDFIQIAPNKRDPKMTRALIDDDIEEIKTRVKLRTAFVKMHLDFFTSADQSTPEQGSASNSDVQ